MSEMAERLARVHARIARACETVGRNPSEVRLVAVSKTHPADRVREAWEAGQRVFGENYAQSLRDKSRELEGLEGLEWHFIGPIQSNKVRYLVGPAALLHSIDRADVARAVNDRAERTGVERVRCLLSVNVGDEASKSGVAPEDLESLYREVADLPRLRVEGLFCLPPYTDAPEAARRYFVRLRELLEALRNKTGDAALKELSMGMSHDLEVAVEEGATMVRVGTDIFGERERKA